MKLDRYFFHEVVALAVGCALWGFGFRTILLMFAAGVVACAYDKSAPPAD